MTDLVIKYLNFWNSYGFAPLNWFSAGASSFDTPYGTWALTEDMNNVDVPKIKGIDAVRSKPPAPLAIGILIPGPLNATEFVGHPFPLKDPYLRYLGMNSTFYYIVRVQAAGMYTFTAWTASTMTGSKLGLSIVSGGVNAGEQVIVAPNTGNEDTFVASPTTSWKLESGLAVLRLHVLTERGYNVQRIVVTGPV